RELALRPQRLHREFPGPVELLAGAGRGAEAIAVLKLRLGAKIGQCELDRTERCGKWLTATAILEMHLAAVDRKGAEAQRRHRGGLGRGRLWRGGRRQFGQV